MTEYYEKRRKTFGDWATIGGVILALVLAAAGGYKTAVLNDYRLEHLEANIKDIDNKLDTLDRKLSSLEGTYNYIIREMKRHEWSTPPGWDPN